MKKIITLEVTTQMANHELKQWIESAVALQTKHDPAHRELTLAQVHVQKIQNEKGINARPK